MSRERESGGSFLGDKRIAFGEHGGKERWDVVERNRVYTVGKERVSSERNEISISIVIRIGFNTLCWGY